MENHSREVSSPQLNMNVVVTWQFWEYF